MGAAGFFFQADVRQAGSSVDGGGWAGVVAGLRQHCQPVAGALHGAATRDQRAARIGDGTRAVLRQVLTESLLLAGLGGAAGLVFSFQGQRAAGTGFQSLEDRSIHAILIGGFSALR